jgi:hypothetical protein
MANNNSLYNMIYNHASPVDPPPDDAWVTITMGQDVAAPEPPQLAISGLEAARQAVKTARINKAYSSRPFSALTDEFIKDYTDGVEKESKPEEPMDINKKKVREVIATAQYDPSTYPNVDYCFDQMKITPKCKLPVIAKSPDVCVGIELEVENVVWNPGAGSGLNSNLFNHVWAIVEDASLRNHGREFVSRVGIKAKDIPKALEMFRTYMETATNGKSEATYRCGTHVHIDVRELTIGQYINMLSLYILFEDYFYFLAGEGRKDNIFCVPINGSECGVSGLYSLVRKDKPTPKDFKKLFSRFSKYMAYNLRPTGFVGNPGRPVTPIGTVEFRHHEGCSDTVRLSNWVQAIVDLYHTAQQFSCHELLDLIFNLNSISTYKEFSASVFTNSIPLTNQQLEDCMYQGSRHIKELYLEEESE